MNPKVITFYLPQFHSVPENDKWWGKGFTDWISAKNSKPLYPGHYQPRVPDYNNYYNLLEKSTMEWQAQLAKKAGVYGFCMYHYWFGDDKQILEKPAENLLNWKDIDINYCFSWANESWITSWSKLVGNAWTDGNGSVVQGTGNGVLLEQKYGNEREWEKHFMYLLPFFKDNRYIKKDGKPVFVIYKPNDIPRLQDMIRYWRELAKKHGLQGIHIVGTNCRRNDQKNMDARLMYEPNYTRLYDKGFLNEGYEFVRKELGKRNIDIPQFINYDLVWKLAIKRTEKNNIYPGGCVDFDGTPRKGRKSIIMYGANPKKFHKYFSLLYKKCKKNNTEFIFLTAWNEWGEGAYLEPDKRYGVAYLNAIRKVIKESD